MANNFIIRFRDNNHYAIMYRGYCNDSYDPESNIVKVSKAFEGVTRPDEWISGSVIGFRDSDIRNADCLKISNKEFAVIFTQVPEVACLPRVIFDKNKIIANLMKIKSTTLEELHRTGK